MVIFPAILVVVVVSYLAFLLTLKFSEWEGRHNRYHLVWPRLACRFCSSVGVHFAVHGNYMISRKAIEDTWPTDYPIDWRDISGETTD